MSKHVKLIKQAASPLPSFLLKIR